MKKQDQQNKEFEEFYYPEMANEPTMPGDFFEPKLKDEIIPAEEILIKKLFQFSSIKSFADINFEFRVNKARFYLILEAMEEFAEQFKKK